MKLGPKQRAIRKLAEAILRDNETDTVRVDDAVELAFMVLRDLDRQRTSA